MFDAELWVKILNNPSCSSHSNGPQFRAKHFSNVLNTGGLNVCLIADTAARLRCTRREVFHKAAAFCSPVLNGEDAYKCWYDEGYIHIYVLFFIEETLGLAHTVELPKYRSRAKNILKGGL